MIIATLLLAAATPSASEFNGDLAPYSRCLRYERREPVARDDLAGEFAPGQWPEAVIPGFAHTIRYCEPLRSKVLIRAREIVRDRHPEWQAEVVERAAETILARIELDILQFSLRLPMTSHGEVEDW